MFKIMAVITAMAFTTIMTGCDPDTGTPGTPETPETTVEPEVADAQEPAVELESAETPEALFQQLINLMNEMGEQLESVGDHDSADIAAREFDNRLTPRMKALAERLLAFEEELGVEALDEIADQFDDPGEAAAERLFTQIERIGTDDSLNSPALEVALQNFEEMLDSLD